MGSKEEISEIKIFSNVPFSTSGNASDLLNQYFEISGLGQDDNFMDIDAVLATKPRLGLRTIKLRLKSKPEGELTHRFTIQYKQANGESYSATTQQIRFN